VCGDGYRDCRKVENTLRQSARSARAKHASSSKKVDTDLYATPLAASALYSLKNGKELRRLQGDHVSVKESITELLKLRNISKSIRRGDKW